MTVKAEATPTAVNNANDSLPVAVASLAPSAPVESEIPSIFQPPASPPEESIPGVPEAPKAFPIDRPSTTDDNRGSNKVCRICKLSETDTNFSPNQEKENPLIVPCQCPGYVHARCLSKWRLYQSTSEFSACRTCGFHYHLKGRTSSSNDTKKENKEFDNTRAKRWNRVRMIMTLSSDCFLVTLVVQIFCVGFAAAIYFIDSNRAIAAAMDGLESCVVGQEHHTEGEIGFFCSNVLTMYYGMGVICFLAMIGMLYCCCFNCLGVPEEAPSVKESHTQEIHHTPNFYQKRHQNCCTNCELACQRKVGYLCRELRYSMVYCWKQGHPCAECCCGGEGSSTSHHHRHRSSSSSSNNHSRGGGGWDGGGAGIVVLVIVVGIIVVFAIFGFIMAMVVSVVLAQRIAQGRVYMIHKRRLVKEFPVMDLKEMDAEAGDDKRQGLNQSDLQSLRKVGLLEPDSPYHREW